jgi:ubiquinone/menaquinone biosynthesis C-methylase UbiE
MADTANRDLDWGSSFRMTAADKWKAKSAVMGRAATDTLVDYAQPKAGMQVLDLASGTGEPAITLAARIAPGGHIVALDQSAEMLVTAAERAQQRGITNLSTRHADAQDLPFADESFDLITSRFGVMFFPDAMRAMQEARRVLRHQARACYLAWGPVTQPFWHNTMQIAHNYAGGDMLVPGGPDIFRFAKPGSLSEALRAGGFAEVHEEALNLPWPWEGSAEEFWEFAQTIATPFIPMLKRIPRERGQELTDEIASAVRKFQKGDRIEFTIDVVLASGRK